MTIYRISEHSLDELSQTTFEEAGIKERADLQRLLREQIETIAPDTLVISEEFSDWEGSSRRIDLLGLDKTGRLVVIELKRTQSGDYMELQALRYAAMVSTMTFERAVDVYRSHLQKLGKDDDPQEALLSFLGWSEPDEERFAQEVSLVLAAADFSQELTTSVMWLINYGLDIRCVRLRPYKYETEILLDVVQVIPLPEATEYQVKLRDKRIEERKTNSKNEEMLVSFWREFLEKSRLKTTLHSNISPTKLHWVSAATGYGGVAYNCVLNKHNCYIELHIDRGDKQENKRIFDALQTYRNEVEQLFDGTLIWDRQDDNKRSLVKYDVIDAGLSDENRWQEIQTKLLDALTRFENAIQPHINKLITAK